jgi:hypothetical protein
LWTAWAAKLAVRIAVGAELPPSAIPAASGVIRVVSDNAQSYWLNVVPGAGIEPTRPFGARDFKLAKGDFRRVLVGATWSFLA